MKGDVKNTRRKAQAANAGRRRKKRAGRRGLHRVVVLLFFLSAGAVLCLTVFFKVEAVYVVGTDKYDPAEVALSSGVVEGQNLLRISKSEIADSIIAQYPYIKSVEVNRKLPPAVEIHVTQDVPAGAVKEGDNYVFINEEGKVLERGLMFIPPEIPMIMGLDT
ncbi:MAG: FtsQ-type POTRA domain-containing protein, partial [Oscillospiraceae bacterium]|nr:FtsQ-type POTRA domain-containing protein [Oscillospiraceae bacterium]